MTETDKKKESKNADGKESEAGKNGAGKDAVDKKRGWPVWSKILITLVVVSITGTFALGLTSIFTLKRMGTDMVDQVRIAAAAHKIADFPNPLPAGYRYLVGLSLDALGISIVTIEHESDKQLLTLSSSDGNLKGDLNDLLDFGYQVGLNMLTTNAKFTGITERGKMKVASYEIPYILGNTLDVRQRAGVGLVGALQLPVKEPKKNILIYALQSEKVPYNQQTTLNLLNSIKSF